MFVIQNTFPVLVTFSCKFPVHPIIFHFIGGVLSLKFHLTDALGIYADWKRPVKLSFHPVFRSDSAFLSLLSPENPFKNTLINHIYRHNPLLYICFFCFIQNKFSHIIRFFADRSFKGLLKIGNPLTAQHICRIFFVIYLLLLPISGCRCLSSRRDWLSVQSENQSPDQGAMLL